MTQSRDKKPTTDQSAKPANAKSSGRVSFDARGNSVWEWQVQTGVYSTEVNTESVRKLELDELSLEDSAIRSLEEKAPKSGKPSTRVQDPPTTSIELERSTVGGGFNPYDNSTRGGGRDPYDNARLTAQRLNPKPRASVPGPKKPPPTELRKLGKWIKLKRALLGKRGED